MDGHMTSDFSPEFQAELLDDFYTECDEHLGSMREQLTRLDRSVATETADPAAIESVFRSLHSLKGISAMVALRPAEVLAHTAEDFLRQLSRGERRLDQEGLAVLIDSVQRLEQIIGAHRLRQAIPDTATVLDQLSALGRNAPPALSPPVAAPVSPPLAASSSDQPAGGMIAKETWRCVFSPSKERDAQGINLTTVRARLGQAGEIMRATPLIGSGGTMSFEFIVAFREAPADLATWEADGLQLELVKPVPLSVAREMERRDGEGATPASSLFIAPSHIVRVDLSRLDELMRITGELVIHRSRLDERLLRVVGPPGNDRSGLQEVNAAIARSLRDLREAISRVRLVSVAEIFTRMPFVIKDLIQATGKEARLVLEGQQTEVDKYLVERLKEPLLHLVRNAFAHGVESREERLAAGKAAEATILLRATTVGQSVLIQIRDDGRGVDAAAVAQRAAAAGLSVPVGLDNAGVLDLLCTTGFSTREKADRAAGRGVGMAVVQATVRELGGSLTLETEKGRWTQFTLRLPLTLSIIEAFIVSAGEQTCAVPQSLTQEIIQVSASQIRTIQQVEVVPYRDGILPLVRLRSFFCNTATTTEDLTILVFDSDRGRVGLVVDRVKAQREVVVRPMQDPLIRVPGISGATELGDGRPVLILDSALAAQSAVRPRSSATPSQRNPQVRASISS